MQQHFRQRSNILTIRNTRHSTVNSRLSYGSSQILTVAGRYEKTFAAGVVPDWAGLGAV